MKSDGARVLQPAKSSNTRRRHAAGRHLRTFVMARPAAERGPTHSPLARSETRRIESCHRRSSQKPTRKLLARAASAAVNKADAPANESTSRWSGKRRRFCGRPIQVLLKPREHPADLLPLPQIRNRIGNGVVVLQPERRRELLPIQRIGAVRIGEARLTHAAYIFTQARKDANDEGSGSCGASVPGRTAAERESVFYSSPNRRPLPSSICRASR